MVSKKTSSMRAPIKTRRLIKTILGLVLGLFSLVLLSSFVKKDKPRVLVFSKTQGFYHESIAQGNKALLKMGSTWGFDVDTTTNAAVFTHSSLQRYDAVVFLSTSGELFNTAQKEAFKRFIQKGGGFVGIHAATTTHYDWPWYGELVGAYFVDHPSVQQADLYIEKADHPATSMLPKKWISHDEWYNFRDIQPGIQVLITIDEDSYQGGTNGQGHPISWFREYDGGRSFYTSLGHTKERYTEPLFLQHLLGGISYAVYGDDRLSREK